MNALESRPAAVAGLFYPATRPELAKTMSELLDIEAQTEIRPKALIVPHAGYIYSGPAAAAAYVALRSLGEVIRRVVLLGPVHRVPVRGLATTSARCFETPLGVIPIDRTALETALHLPQVSINDLAHGPEHSLEVQLPFLQSVLGDFSLAPFVVGDASDSEVGEVLEMLWGGDETLIVISSDLSHYLPYELAQRRDRATVDAILGLHRLTTHEQACGATPINGLLDVARRKDLHPQLISLCNSGDTAGDRGRVVGYASLSFQEPADGRR